MKKLLYIFFALLSVWTFAFGSKDITAVNITSMESWQETVDISRKQQGKYNILIQAKDIAGNVGYAGPLNVYIDPKSDFPTAYIAYPLRVLRYGETWILSELVSTTMRFRTWNCA